MKHYQRLFLLLIILCSGLHHSLFAQSLQLTDILKLYSLDSSAARQFCVDKQFNVTTAGNTSANMRYGFASGDSTTRLEISYPNDSTSLNVQLNYWFNNTKAYKQFKTALRKNGFTRQSAKQIEGTLPSYAERYINKNLQVELISPGDEQPYWLFLHPVGNYTW